MQKKTIGMLSIFLVIVLLLSVLILAYVQKIQVELTDKSALSSVLLKFKNYEEYNIEDAELKNEFDFAKGVANEVFSDTNVSQEYIDKTVENANVIISSVHSFLFEAVSLKANTVELVDEVYINDIKCAFDSASETFYFPLDVDRLENAKINIKCIGGLEKNIYATIYKDNETMPTFFDVTLSEKYTLKAISHQYAYEYSIIFIGMPIIQINDIDRIGEIYKDCSFSLIDPSFSYKVGYKNYIYFESNAKLHIRGGVSRSYPKNSYALKLVTEDESNNDYSMLGMRTDSDYILDSMYIDKARMRNRVCTDIWNDFSVLPSYSEILGKDFINGTNGKFVEIFINDEYRGLYCLTEKIDRKQLKLVNYDEDADRIRGVIYKGYTWDDIICFKDYRPFSNEHSTWGGWEQKFPNPSKDYNVMWEPIANVVKFYMEASDEEFRDYIKDYIDLDVFIDYTILMCITYACDNTGKNAYWSVFDIQNSQYNKVFITPWDFDASFGRTWESSKMNPDAEWMDTIGGHDTTLFRRLVLTNADGFRDKLVARWNSLKKDELSPEKLIKYFADYFDLFEKTGAFEREKEKWAECELNMQEEKEYINQWIKKRFTYIDDYMNNKLVDDLQKIDDKKRQ